MSSSKESLSSSALVSHAKPLLLSATTLGRLFAAKSALIPLCQSYPLLTGIFVLWHVLSLWESGFPIFFNDLRDAPVFGHACSYSRTGGP